VTDAREDLDARAAAHYGCDVPVLVEGDIIKGLPDNPGSYVVVGFAAGGMLVEVNRLGDGMPLSLPRFYVPMHGDPFFLTASDA